MDALIEKQLEQQRYITRFLENTQKIGKDRLTPEYLKSRIVLLDRYWGSYESNHYAILNEKGAKESAYYTADHYAETEGTYTWIRSQLSGAVEGASTATRAVVPNEPSALTLMQQLMIPKAELPEFSGNQREWEGYRDLYVSLVHENVGVPAAHKLQLLRASLTGEALACIGGFESNDAGYQSAWETLLARYNDQRSILRFHMRALLNLPSARKPSDKALKGIISTVQQAIRAFRGLGRPVEHWDDWLIHLILERIDNVSRILWEATLKSKNEFPTFAKFLEFLQTRARSLAAAADSPASSSVSPPRSKASVYSNFTSKNADKRKAARTTLSCVLCKQQHILPYCPQFRAFTVAQRRAFVTQQQLCFNCLRSGHRSEACPSTSCCLKCQGRHHTMVHAEATRTSSATSPISTAAPTPAQSDSTLTASTSVSANVAALATTTRGTVLLATARVFVENACGQRVAARALLDSGSEASFVTEKLVQQLKLSRTKVHVPITGLQGRKTGRAGSEVSFILKSHDLATATPLSQVLVLPSIAVLCNAEVAAASWPHITGLPLADPDFAHHAPVDLLIGADVYSSLLRDGIKHGPMGTPTAQLTALGWVLMGSTAAKIDIRL